MKPREKLKVTDKRLFTADGDVRDEYRGDIQAAKPADATPTPARVSPEPRESKEKAKEAKPEDPLRNPGTPFSMFIESLVVNAYMSLGMLRSPYQPEPAVDLDAARQMIDMIRMLEEKTTGNLTPDEQGFVEAHLADLKLAYVRRGKAL